ncbi:MAG TPA: hypothetical protein VN026_09660 [Bacteroidia bacterium]|jgi:hypothetical protein|nr:hypothetical protein [Bacteroidia bacterium]
MIDYKSIPVYNYSHIYNIGLDNYAIYTDTVSGKPLWTCADWVTFFKALASKYGEAKAIQIWTYWWNLGLSKSAGGAGDIKAGSGLVYDSVPLDCRTFDSDFRAFLDKYKLQDVVYKGLGVIAKPLGVGVDIVENVASTVDTTSKVLKYAIPTLVVVASGLLIWWGVRKAKS